jgi:signal transduction histidine kinase
MSACCFLDPSLTRFAYRDPFRAMRQYWMHSQSRERQAGYPNELSAPDLLETLRRSEIEIEAEKSSIARTLHDEVGGLLVGAVMDMSWISQQSGQSEVVKDKLARAVGLLREAIDIKRKLVEALRPSLLDDVGLCSTIGWHLKTSCNAAGVEYSERYPPQEPPFCSEFKIGVFRIVQKALTQILSDGVPSKLSLHVEIVEDTLHCHIVTQLLEPRVAVSGPDAVNTPLHHRTRQLGGVCHVLRTLEGNHVHVTIPMPQDGG